MTSITLAILRARHDQASDGLIAQGFSRQKAASRRELWNAASVTCSGCMGGPNKIYNVEIDLHRFEHPLTPRPAKPFHWSGRAHNTYDARAKAWSVWLASIALREGQ